MRKLREAFKAAVVAVPLAFAGGAAQAGDIVDTAVSAGSFETLVAAVKAAGLVETLKGDGPFTVFAPTDEAFAELPAGTIDELLKPENKDQLVKILTFHVVPGKIMAGDVKGAQPNVRSVEGGTLYVDGTSSKGVTIAPMRTYNASKKSNVITANIVTDNGVIHVIDKVLLPAS